MKHNFTYRKFHSSDECNFKNHSSGSKDWKRKKEKTFHVFILLVIGLLLLIGNQKIWAQNPRTIPDSTGAVRLNFGLDADVYGNHLQFGYFKYNRTPLPGTTPTDTVNDGAGTDDWFKKQSQWPGIGIGILDTVDRRFSPAVNASAYKAGVSSTYANHTFFVKSNQSYPPFTPIHFGDGRYPSTVLDALGFRDNIATGGFQDSSVFVGTSDKDSDNPHTWNMGTGGVPQKNDLVDLGAMIRQDTALDPRTNFRDIWAGAFATTISTDGSSHLDFEVFRDINYLPDYATYLMHVGNPQYFRFAGLDSGHTAAFFNFTSGIGTVAGDFLFTIDLEKGGRKPVYDLFIWINASNVDGLGHTLAQYIAKQNPNTFVPNNNPFNFTGTFIGGLNTGPYGYAEITLKDADFITDPPVFARVNTDPITSPGTTGNILGAPWGNLVGASATPQDSIEKLQNTEILANLTRLLGPPFFGNNSNCQFLFGNLMVKTRTAPANSLSTAEMKDYGGPFQFGAILPLNILATGGNIDCNHPAATLHANVSGVPQPATVCWQYSATGAAGSYANVSCCSPMIPPFDCSYSATIAGYYRANVSFSGGGCSATSSVQVSGNFTRCAVNCHNVVLNCNHTTDAVNASSTDATCSYYIRKGSTIIAVPHTFRETVSGDDNGTDYYLVSMNSTSGCKDSCAFSVSRNFNRCTVSCNNIRLGCTNSTPVTVSDPGTTSCTYVLKKGKITIALPHTFSQTISGDPDTTYWLYSTNINSGCKDSCSFTVSRNFTPPNVSATGGSISCIADSVRLLASSSNTCVKFSWTGPNGFTSTEQNPVVRDSGTFTVTARDTCNGCINTATAHVDIVIPTIGNCGSGGPITSGFELDGNAVSVAPNPPDDWDLVNTNSSNAFSTTGVLSDAPSANDNLFVQGTKDLTDVTGWHYSMGSTPDKDDILHGGAALYGTKLYFFGDRFAVNGNAQIGFWFFKGNVQQVAGSNTFTGQHVVGDLLVLSNFINGGGTPVIFAYEWVGSGGSDGTLNALTLSGANSFAIVNAGVQPSPWPFQAKFGPANQFPAGAFFEGGLDISCLPGVDPCFQSFMLETRTSSSVSAELKDFIAGNFTANAAHRSSDPALVSNNSTVAFEAYPNPFSSSTSIHFMLNQASAKTSIDVFSADGNKVATLFNGPAEQGVNYQLTFGGNEFAEGIYFCRISTENGYTSINKLILMK